MTQDPYATLGVARDADAETIKKAHRKRAKETHPDVGGDPEEFRAVSKAVAVLSDPAKRAEYDATGTISDDVNDPIEHGALNLIGMMFATAMNGSDDPCTFDIVGRMSSATLQEIAGLKQEIVRMTKVIGRLERVAKKFRRKSAGKQNLLARMAEQHVKQAEATRRNAETMLAQREKVIEILADHEFDWDKPPPQERAPYMTATQAAAMQAGFGPRERSSFFFGNPGA